MKYTTISLFVIISFLMNSCGSMKNAQYSIKEGVYGKILWIQGNMMPSPDLPDRGNGKPIKRTVKIYEQTNLKQVDGEAPLFKSVKTRLVETVRSDKNGHYEAKLLPGRYSVFTVEENGKLFANSLDGQGVISSIEIKANEVIVFDIKINYKAYY